MHPSALNRLKLNFGSEIAGAAKRKELLQREVANRADVSVGTVSAVYRSSPNVGFDSVFAIANAIDPTGELENSILRVH